MTATVTIKCHAAGCNNTKKVRKADVDRGWGMFCCKACAASFREDTKKIMQKLGGKKQYFISGPVKQSGNGKVRNTKLRNDYWKPVKEFDWDGEPSYNVTYEDIMKQPSLYEV